MQPDMQMQAELEKLLNKNHLMPRLRSEFRQPEVIDHCIANQIPVNFAIELLCQMALHKRASVGILVGILHPQMDMGDPTQAVLQACADQLYMAALAGLVAWDDSSHQFVIQIDLNECVYKELEMFQYPLPMVVEPREVKTNRDSGYITSKSSLILKSGNHHDEDICLDHINRVNRVPLTINLDTARMVANEWKNLDRQKTDETLKDYQDRVKAFQKYDRNAKDVIEHLTMVGDRIWLTHKYDKRGRTYAQGYHCSTQGNPWNKAILEFADKEVVSS